MRKMFCLWIMLLSFAVAQADDKGLEKVEAEDGSLYCSQSIYNSTRDGTGIQLGVLGDFLTIVINRDASDGPAFDAFGPTGDELGCVDITP